MRPERQSAVTLGALALITGLVAFAILEVHGVEQRLAVQGQQLRALGEATDRLASQGVRVAANSGTSPSSAVEEMPAHVLHPEVPNFLKPNDKHWPAPGASLDGTLARGWASGDPKGFNPMIENSQDIVEVISPLCGASLADRNVWGDPTNWHAELATRVEITDDFKEFTFYLRKGVKWNAPMVDVTDQKHGWLRGDHEVTAQDLVFTLDLMMNPQVSNGFLKNYYKELESWKALDDTTFVVRWKKKEYLNIDSTLSLAPTPRFLFAFDEDGTPFPKETLGLRFNQHWYNNKGYVGAGPYRMAKYEPGSKIRLVRNEEFFGNKPAIKELVFPIYTDPNQTILKLKAHEIGLGGLTPGQYRDEIQQYEGSPNPPKASPFFDGRLVCDRVPRFGFYYLGWNADRPLFADKRVRRAMTFALNRKQIIDSVFAGLGQMATGPYQADSPANDPNIKPIPFDLDAARQLLTEAGWKDTDGDGLLDKEIRPGDGKRSPFEFTLLIYGSSKEIAALANIFKEDLLKIGVKLNVDAAEWSLMQKRMEEKNFDAFTGGWGTAWETDLYQIWHSSQADVPKGSNRVGFRNKRADAIIEKVRVTFDPAERIELFREFHRLVDDEQPYTFLISRRDVICHWKDVKEVAFAKSPPVINTLPWSVSRGAN